MAYWGSCLCTAIRFKVDVFEQAVAHCHCRMCQKFHGAGFSTLAEVKLEHLTWLSGQNKLVAYQAQNKTIRQFCQVCGASVSFSSRYNRADHTIEIPLALIDKYDDNSPIPLPNAHIYCDSEAKWLNNIDQLPKYKGYRPTSDALDTNNSK